jgi:catechol 2,3-dioxygenase-like lactoylglutathione lyase family enzyme
MSAPSGVSHIAVVTGDLDGFRAFYEDTLGLRTTIVFGGGRGHSRQAILMAGDAMLHVFEVANDRTATQRMTAGMFERGRLDHLGFTVTDLVALRAIRDRLLAVDASSGDIRSLGPMLSLRFVDPDGSDGELNCYNTKFDPSTLRDEDEVIDPDWLVLTKRALQPGAGTDRRQPSGAARLHPRTHRRTGR